VRRENRPRLKSSAEKKRRTALFLLKRTVFPLMQGWEKEGGGGGGGGGVGAGGPGGRGGSYLVLR